MGLKLLWIAYGGRIKLSAAILDACEEINLSTKYSNQRIQFGVPISKFGVIKHKLADMAVRTYVIESATYRAGNDIEKNIFVCSLRKKINKKHTLKELRNMLLNVLSQIMGSETIQFCSDEGIQIYGGMGYSAEAPMEAAYRDARISRIYEGTNEINRMLLVGMILKKAMKGELDIITLAMKAASDLMSIPSFKRKDEKLFNEKEHLKNLKKAILMIAGKSAKHYGINIDKEQELLMNLADMVVDVYRPNLHLKNWKLTHKNGQEKINHRLIWVNYYIKP